MNESVREFARLATSYCDWIEDHYTAKRVDILKVRYLLAHLYATALDLPNVELDAEADRRYDERSSVAFTTALRRTEPEGEQGAYLMSTASWIKVFMGLEHALPFYHYRYYFSPADLAEDDPGVRNLADDLTDVYRDVREGLLLYKNGLEVDAVFEWKQSFTIHWGRHAVSALQALHTYIVDQEIE